MKRQGLTLASALLSAVFILGCQDLGQDPLGPDGPLLHGTPCKGHHKNDQGCNGGGGDGGDGKKADVVLTGAITGGSAAGSPLNVTCDGKKRFASDGPIMGLPDIDVDFSATAGLFSGGVDITNLPAGCSTENVADDAELQLIVESLTEVKLAGTPLFTMKADRKVASSSRFELFYPSGRIKFQLAMLNADVVETPAFTKPPTQAAFTFSGGQVRARHNSGGSGHILTCDNTGDEVTADVIPN